jgi:putative ABC transport system ATP-binding protein
MTIELPDVAPADPRPGVEVVARGVGVVRSGTWLIEGIDVDVEPGRIIAVTGPSGSGKSTLLSVLAGLIEPDSGEIAPADRARHAGVVFQGYCLLPTLTAAENVELPLQLQGTDADEIGARAAVALARAGLAEVPDRLAEELSGGQRQRVAVARALGVRPGLLVADEPTAELDAVTAAMVFAALRAEADAGSAVVIATHDLELAGMCDTVIHLVDGRVGPGPDAQP